MTDKQQIEEMAILDCQRVPTGTSCADCPFARVDRCNSYRMATKLYNAGYRKLPENAVVLTREDMKKYAEDCIAGQETGLDIINALIARAERYKEQAKQTRKETAEKILKMFDDKNYITEDDLKKAIAKQFGVEVEE